jgi:hypothetical protein
VKIYQLALAQAIVAAQLEMSAQVEKSAIHAGFGPLHKIVINHVSARASLSQIFLMMSLVKS